MNHLFLISGPSGSGKTTLMQRAMENKVITMTTRPKREGERDGVDYYFVSKTEFETFIKENKTIEYEQYTNGHYYGITYEKLNEQISKGDAYVIVESNGMKKYKSIYPDAVSLFIYTNYDDTKKQLLERGGDLQDIEDRLNSYEHEKAEAHLYDYVIKNKYGKFEEVTEILKAIIKTEK